MHIHCRSLNAHSALPVALTATAKAPDNYPKYQHVLPVRCILYQLSVSIASQCSTLGNQNYHSQDASNTQYSTPDIVHLQHYYFLDGRCAFSSSPHRVCVKMLSINTGFSLHFFFQLPRSSRDIYDSK